MAGADAGAHRPRAHPGRRPRGAGAPRRFEPVGVVKVLQRPLAPRVADGLFDDAQAVNALATLGVALVAVSVGMRLVYGHIPLSAALTALLLAPFGGFSVCIAAITAAICMGPDVHPDPQRRYMGAVAAGGFYLLAGLFGGAIGLLFSALPVALIHTIAGLALLGTIGGSLQAVKNTGGLSINNNTIDGNLQCKENQPAPTGSGNTAALKTDQCRAL